MLDPKLLRRDLDQVKVALQRRHFELDTDRYQLLENKRSELQQSTESLQNIRNKNSKLIGQAKSQGEDASELLAEMEKVSAGLKQNEKDLVELQAELHAFQLTLPNLLHADVPTGKDESDNVEVKVWGDKTSFTFPVKDHIQLGEDLGILDFERSVKLSGSRFVVMTGMLAKLQRALVQFMLDMHTKEHGYTEVYVPYLVNPECLYGTGQLPKFADDFFKVAGDRELVLIPTAEVPLVNLHREELLDESQLPLKYTAQTPCFRSEAGSYGKDTRGLIRQHQFQKVELVQITKPEHSYAAQEEILQQAEKVLQLLKLPYRVVVLCSGDTGFSATRTFDIEVWLPGQDCYREIGSISNCEDFQARRMKLRYRNAETKKNEFVHTLNGTGLALGRTIVAILENYQNTDGNIVVPEVLRPYLDGAELISPN
jgi:seryl-tRNA synthetase